MLIGVELEHGQGPIPGSTTLSFLPDPDPDPDLTMTMDVARPAAVVASSSGSSF